jgi:hypothetical protein
MAPTPVAERLRAEVDEIGRSWETAVLARQPELRQVERAALLDHLPEFLIGLAAWIDGDDATGRRGFTALVEGHALQRLGHGIELETLSIEYQVLRSVILSNMLALKSTLEIRRQLIRLNEGIDFATSEAIHRYAALRNEVRERFVAILGHDLRSPLGSIMLAANGIAMQACDHPKHASNAEVIERSAARMQRMIDDVLDFARAHLRGGIPATPVACDLGIIATDAVHEIRAAHPSRDLRVTTIGDLRGYWDPDRITQALVNLVSNALQHGSDPVEIVVEEQPDHLAVITRVTNRGSSIPARVLERMFQPFATDPERRTGLGLGLFIVQQIALSHGGLCSVTSREGLTSFEIRWPRVPLAKRPR